MSIYNKKPSFWPRCLAAVIWTIIYIYFSFAVLPFSGNIMIQRQVNGPNNRDQIRQHPPP